MVVSEKKQGSGMAIASLVLGIFGLLLGCVFIGIVPAIISLVLSIIVLAKSKPGKGMAIAGLVTSIIGILIFVLIMLGVAGSKDVQKGLEEGYSAAMAESTMGSEKEETTKPVQEETMTEAPAIETEVKSEYTVGDIIEADKELKITILSAGEYTSDNQFIQPADGKIFYKVDLEMENTSEKDTTVSSMIGFEAYEDGYSISETYASGVENGLDGSLAAGKKIKGSLVYEISKDWKELEVQYKPNVWLDKKIIMKFENQ